MSTDPRRSLISAIRAPAFAAALAASVLAFAVPSAGAVPFANSLRLDGVDDYASAADSGALDLGNADGEDFTIESFVYVPDTTSDANETIFLKNQAYSMFVNFDSVSTDAIFFRVWLNSVTSVSLSNTTNLATGWHHVAGVFDNEFTAGNDRIAIYLDGTEFASNSTFEVTPGVFNSTQPLHVGANFGGVPWDGFFDDARLSDITRYTGSYTVPSSAFTSDANTKALWHFDEAACSTSFADSSTNAVTLAGQNGAQTGVQGASAPTLQFDAPSYQVVEGGGSATITVTRTGDPVPAVGVTQTTTDGTATAGSDYTDASGSLGFGCGVMSQTFAVPIAQDVAFEGDETVNLALSLPTGGAVLGSPTAATLTIIDDDFSAARVRDINTGAPGSGPAGLTSVDGVLYFAATTAGHGTELWRSNGTSGGTALVRNINPGGASSSPASLTRVGSTLYFAADNGISGTELWKSDGTTAGTVLVRNINPGGSSAPAELTNVGGTLFFTADDGAQGTELWKSDGTTAGTVLVKDIAAGAASSSPTQLTNVGGTLFFAADDGVDGTELWKSDGTAAGTVLVKDIDPAGRQLVARRS